MKLHLFGPEVNVGNFPPSPSQVFSDEEEQRKVTWSQVGTIGGLGQNLDVLLLQEGHSDLGFVGFAQLWDPFF